MVLYSIAAVLLSGGVAWAHGGAAIDMDPCIERAGVHLIHFSAYQPQEYSTEEYCRSLPKTGGAILVFDLIEPELRKKPVKIRIIRKAETAATGTILEIPFRIYPSGVVSAEVNFLESGRYVALVQVEGLEREVEFPVRVAVLSYAVIASGAAGFIGAGMAGLWFWRPRTKGGASK